MGIASHLALENVTGTVTGAEFKGEGTAYTMQCTGTFSAEIRLEGSSDGTNWRSLAVLYGPDGTMVADEFYPRLRVRCHAFTSGSADGIYINQVVQRFI